MKKYAIVVIGVLSLSACGSSTTKTQLATTTVTTTATTVLPSDTATTDTAATDTATTDTSASAGTADSPASGNVGGTLTLQDDNNNPLDVTVKDVHPFTAGEYDQSNAGDHWVGVDVTWNNSGGALYRDAPDNEVKLIDAAGNSIDSDIVSSGCMNDSSMSVPAGQTRQGCVAFQVPDGDTLKTVDVQLNSGYAGLGEWTIK